MLIVFVKVEQIEQVTKSGAIGWHVRVSFVLDRIGEIVAAPRRERTQSPVPFDKLQDRNVVGVRVVDVAAFCEV